MALKLRDVMSTEPVAITAERTLAFAEELMAKFDCRHLPVEKDGAVLGVLSDRDIALALSVLQKPSTEVSVELACTRYPYSAGPEDALSKVLKDMVELTIGSVLIMDGDKLLGIFTALDACEVLRQHIE